MKLPQLSLRDLFWLVALVAMGCGWWIDRSKMTDLHEELRQVKERLEFTQESLQLAEDMLEPISEARRRIDKQREGLPDNSAIREYLSW